MLQEEMGIASLISPAVFPPQDGKWLINVMGIRANESSRRVLGIHSMRSFVGRPHGPYGVRNAWPIYDWTEGDVWKAIGDYGWDYNRAYDMMTQFRIRAADQRVGPPTMNVYSISLLEMGAKAWPQWFDRVCNRLPGVRAASLYGKRACQPYRKSEESWEECFRRVCIKEAPAEWIATRSTFVMEKMLKGHGRHSTEPFPEVKPCFHCRGGSSLASWKKLTFALYNGDPFGLKCDNALLSQNNPKANPLHKKWIDPEFFRPGAGTWISKPSF